MFALHETTRKYVCRVAFFALCFAPTLFTAWWLAGHHWPGRKGRLARDLSESLDVHVTLADWREPRPRSVRTRGMTLSDPASAHVLTELKTLEVRRGGGVRSYVIEDATVDAAQLPRLAEKIYAWMAKLPPEIHEIQCGKLNVRLHGNAPSGSEADSLRVFTLHHIRGRIDRDATGRPIVQLIGYDAERPTAESPSVRLVLTPASDAGSAAPALTLETIGVAIPAEILRSATPGFGSLGAGATFRGIIRWTIARPEASGVAQGRLDGVDLARLLPAGSPHTLRGLAAVELSELTWRGSRVERLSGAVNASHVQMSRSLVDAATYTHGFQCRQGGSGVTVGGEPSLVAVDLLALRFHLDAEGLSFSGNCPPDAAPHPGCIAVSRGQPLLIEPPYPDYQWPVGVLLQTLSTRPAAWVPATREAVDMASRLPLPIK